MEIFKFNDGIYEGEAIDEVPNGKGRWTLEKDYGYYEGDFTNGLLHGNGKLYFKDVGTFEGNWVDGAFTGEGKVVYPSGVVEEGTFVNMELIRGKRSCLGGEVYEGEFLNGKFHGKGKLIRCDGMVIDGIWENGEFVNIETPYRWEQ